jgi:hypothetical protein
MTSAAPRALEEITADALRARCGRCWAEPGRPCEGTQGVHLARYQRAHRRGVLSAADLTAVLAGVIASAVPAIVTPAQFPNGAAA